MDELENRAAAYLPGRLREAVARAAEEGNAPIREIRLRRGSLLTLTVGEKNVPCGVSCSAEELSETVANLCQQSLYSHAGEIREGVITTDSGIRAGVCGQAVVKDGRLDCVRSISSVCLRIPHRVPGAADALYETVKNGVSALVYSKPGMGKTTVLRELIPCLASGKEAARVAVIDTRFELAAGMDNPGTADIFLGYPRKEGMESAVRTMSPQFILCDEIASEGDAEAVLNAHAAGVAVVATAHGGSQTELRRNPNLGRLLDEGIFGVLCRITEAGVEVSRTDG